MNAFDPSMVTFSTHGWSPLLVTGMSCVMVCRAGARKVKDVDTLAAVTYNTNIRRHRLHVRQSLMTLEA